MKKSEFSYLNGRALSHASLEKYRNQQNKNELITKQTFQSKPSVKYYSNPNEHPSTVATRSDHRRPEEQGKNEQELRRKIKTLEYELKKKLNDNTYMCKLFKTKNSSELTHIDLFLQFRRVEEELELRKQQMDMFEGKIEECGREIEELLLAKEKQEAQHVEEIQNVMSKIERLEKKHKIQMAQKEKIANEQKKAKEDKDVLLKQYRKKYEECQALILNLETELMELKEGKQSIQKTYREKIEKTREDYIYKIEENHNQIEGLSLKIREQEDMIKDVISKSKEKQKQKNTIIKRLEAEIAEKNQSIEQQDIKGSQFAQKLKKSEAVIDELTKLIECKNNELDKLAKDSQSQINLLRSSFKQLEDRIEEAQKIKQKQKRDLEKMQQKLSESSSMIKMLTFQRQQKQAAFNKLSGTVSQKDRKLQQKSKIIEQLQCKLFSAEKICSSSTQRLRQLQKQSNSNKQYHVMRSRLEIENYKCIGRLTELIHQVKQIEAPEKPLTAASKVRNGGKGKHGYGQQNQEQLHTVTECVDELARSLEAFLKVEYQRCRLENKASQELIEEIICDVKTIFHAYNSYVMDDELKGATREYLECLESSERGVKKMRNTYLQVIMERLISILAIKSYASQGMVRKQPQGRFNSRQHKDSLEKTFSDDQAEQSSDERPKQQTMSRVDSKKSIEGLKYKRARESSKKASTKLYTQPESEAYLMRRLEYGKENYMSRNNKQQMETNKYYSYLSQEQHSQGMEPRRIEEKKVAKSTAKQALAKKQLAMPRKQDRNVSAAKLIEQKYFR